MKIYKFFAILFLFLFFLFHASNITSAEVQMEKETLEAEIVQILEKEQKNQIIKLKIINGSSYGEEIIVENRAAMAANPIKYQVGDRVLVFKNFLPDGTTHFSITDFVRREALIFLFAIFVGLTIVVARLRGVSAFLGLAISFFIIFKYILPRIAEGLDPLLIVIIGSIFIIPSTFYIAHGISKKTTAAILGTAISLVFTIFLAVFFVEKTRLTGFSSEEAGFLQVLRQGELNIKGLLLAGMIIGLLGVLDDIAISQAAIVFELKKTNAKLKIKELYLKSMSVGADHISSMINTLILVYAGASLPLLLLFLDSSRSFWEVINYEIVAEEVVRMLVGSICLVLAVPATTAIAALIAEKERNNEIC